MYKIDVDHVVSDNHTSLIILEKTGVVYTAQCGGLGCTHPEAEGFVIDIGDFASANDFNSCNYGCAWLSDEDASEKRLELAKDFDEYCSSRTIGYKNCTIKFDYSRIDETQEAWIPVIVSGQFDYFGDTVFDNAKGFLHNENCD